MCEEGEQAREREIKFYFVNFVPSANIVLIIQYENLEASRRERASERERKTDYLKGLRCAGVSLLNEEFLSLCSLNFISSSRRLELRKEARRLA